eukprot:m.328695 g.328695  ORF g.328695 m.328695 type:complete len:92 (-) comp55592_c0_seq8:249-524(-)
MGGVNEKQKTNKRKTASEREQWTLVWDSLVSLEQVQVSQTQIHHWSSLDNLLRACHWNRQLSARWLLSRLSRTRANLDHAAGLGLLAVQQA